MVGVEIEDLEEDWMSLRCTKTLVGHERGVTSLTQHEGIAQVVVVFRLAHLPDARLALFWFT